MGARIRQYDVLARIGGEEFLLIAPETGLDDAQVLAERLRCSICDAAFEVDGSTIDMTVSFGVHDRSTGRPSAEALAYGAYSTGWYSSGGFTTVAGSATPIAVGTSDVTGINVQMTVALSPPPNVTVTLTPNSIVTPVGWIVALVAVASQDVAPTPYFIVILDSHGTVLAACGGSPTCTATVWSGARHPRSTTP